VRRFLERAGLERGVDLESWQTGRRFEQDQVGETGLCFHSEYD